MTNHQISPSIFARVDRTAGALSVEFAELGVATVHESQGRSGLMDPAIKPLVEGSRVAGPAVTCLNQPGDNLMLLAALDLCQEGDVLVVANLAPSTAGMVGEIISSILLARGAAGLVVDAGVRDVRELRRLPLPVWSRTVSATGTTKGGPGWVNTPVVAGGATVRPGDIVVGDDDGVVVVPRESAGEVLARGKERVEREAVLLKDIAAGRWPGLSPELHEQLRKVGVQRIPEPH
ncbi:4-carboxy-4-hydroxy-2-oxoadipate aldolase/oxaloacetate decarboxylase [Rhodococcus tibetensis]|uniref:Putative 4-hydroxy-4-methyl-2-oxoglutarate aldolase n=1 Tax=Rhodococcus tibetensis TaxID=2965064 RepID=A0ABT1QGQ2_9NOCA|nr:4-carboxy-4-hydroxy-2-oxoadipate aldolase/oxaloacetate decarboxylase [Rhodococcus sp. FXJ9.536]MCQ4120868.1 4-carboxy-4-hydroxy-2-oxoadipate aldolase/oxaloacetate decarboxylase [Rhodococcus sp. FXJ9.536]